MPRLFIMGDQRSGTTLVAELVDAHAGASVRSGMFTRCFDIAHRLGLSPAKPLDRRRSQLLSGALRWDWLATTGTAWPDALDRPHASLDTLHARALAACNDATAHVVGHKEHGPFSMLRYWLDDTDVHVLIVVRDARDVMLSRRSRGEPVLDLRLIEWREHVRRVNLAAPHPQLHIVRFEDAVRSPVRTMAAIATWLGLAPAASLAELQANRPAWTQNSSLAQTLTLCDASAVGRWRARRTDPLCRYAAAVCGRELGSLGYEVPRPPPARELVGYWRRWLTAASLKAASRARDVALRRLFPPL